MILIGCVETYTMCKVAGPEQGSIVRNVSRATVKLTRGQMYHFSKGAIPYPRIRQSCICEGNRCRTAILRMFLRLKL